MLVLTKETAGCKPCIAHSFITKRVHFYSVVYAVILPQGHNFIHLAPLVYSLVTLHFELIA